jgi:CubicO group peptidase (beta-lactamase class C family)
MKKSSFILFHFFILLLIVPIFTELTLATTLQNYWPTLEWQTSTPEEQGMRSRELSKMDDYIESNNWRYYVDSLLIIRNGYIVYERYRTENQRTEPHHIYSCTKVITSTLIGMCVDAGNITSLQNSAMGYFPDYSFDDSSHTKEAITVQHLLSMTSGLEWYDNDDYYSMMATSNPVEYVFNQTLVATPGELWNYNTGCSHVLSNIIQRVSGVGTANLAESALFVPLGITDYTWNTKLGVPNGGTLLYLKSRDMAKIGLLYLNKGNWNGTRIVSEEWVGNATSSFINRNSEWDLYWPEYGYQWWIFKSNTQSGYGARGSYIQNILVLPDLNMVVVSTGAGDFPFEFMVDNYILESVGPNPPLPWIIGSAGIVVVIGGSIGIYSIIKRKRKH